MCEMELDVLCYIAWSGVGGEGPAFALTGVY